VNDVLQSAKDCADLVVTDNSVKSRLAQGARRLRGLLRTGHAAPHAKLSRALIAETYLSGHGIEIGALHNPLQVPPSARVKYVDRLPIAQLREQYPELNDKELVEVDILDDGERLSTIADASQDFVIANHFVEHSQDPIGAVLNMLRVLKPGGVLYLAIPDKRCCFDSDRPVTPIEHLLRDHAEGPEWSRAQHFEEWARLVNKTAEAEVADQTAELIRMNYSIHFHVWTPFEMLELVQALRKMAAFEVELCLMHDGVEVILVFRKSNS
jgi:SAM-dependent methyltransferase